MINLIALVNSDDAITGYADKIEVHQKGLLHRAFSILIFNSEKQMLIHRRAGNKYHSPGLWTNACCSHLPQGASMQQVVYERLQHEMGVVCPLEHSFTFHYRVAVENDLIENEVDHVYFGRFDGNPIPNPDEVAEWKWIALSDLFNDVKHNPENYTYWFKHIILNSWSKIIRFVDLD